MFNIKPGDTGFIMHHGNWISETMAWFMKNPKRPGDPVWSHSFLGFEHADRTDYILETSDWDCRFGDLNRYMVDPTASMQIWRPKNLSDSDALLVTQAAYDACFDKMYGFLQLPDMALRCLGKKIGINIPNIITQGILCDEILLSGYTGSNIPGLAGIKPKSIYTQEVYEIIASGGQFDMVFEKKVS